MDLKKIIKFSVITLLSIGLLICLIHAEDIIIIEPEPETPIDIIPEPTPPPPEEEPVPEPIPEPAPEPEPQINASVDINPETLNINANRKFITAYIELPDGLDVNDIDVASVNISAVNDNQVESVYALNKPSGIGDNDSDGIPDLMVKFDASEVCAVIAPADEVKITLTGTLGDGREFICSDTMRVIGPGKSGDKGNSSGSGISQKFRFCLAKHISSDAIIIKASLWLRYKGDSNYQISLKFRRFNSIWQKMLSKWGRYKYSKSMKGDGCEWDVTDEVIVNWQNGIKDLLIELEKKYGCEKPLLIVTYETSGHTEETPIPEELIVISPRFAFNGENPGIITLLYDFSKLQGVSEKDLTIYYWDEDAKEWRPVPDAQINTQDQSITTTTNGSTVYQILGLRQSVDSTSGNESSGSSSLGQNYPNPFNPGTTVNYSVTKDCHVTLKIYSIAGALVATLVDEYKPAGSYSVYFDGGAELSRGIYYYQLAAGDFVATKRMVVLK